MISKAHLFLLALLFIAPESIWGDDFRISPTVDCRGEYNDNIFWTQTNRKGDEIITVSPGIIMSEKTERFGTAIIGRLDGRIYSRNHDLNTVDHDCTATMNYLAVPHLNFTSKAKISKDSRPDSDIETTGLLVSNIERQRYQADLACSYDFSDRTTGGLRYAYDQDDYNAQDLFTENINEHQSHGVTLSGQHSFSAFIPSILGKVMTSYFRYDFTNQTLDYYAATCGAKRELNEVMDIDINLGVSHARSVFPVMKSDHAGGRLNRLTQESEQTGWVGRVAFSYKGEKTTCDIFYSYDIQPASGRNGATLRNNLKLEITRRVTYKLRTYLYANYFLNKAEALVLAHQDIDEETITIGPGIRYDFTRELKFDGSYSYTDIRNHVNRGTINRNRVTALVTFQHELLK